VGNLGKRATCQHSTCSGRLAEFATRQTGANLNAQYIGRHAGLEKPYGVPRYLAGRVLSEPIAGGWGGGRTGQTDISRRLTVYSSR
jgi:hypothetical protein